MLARRAFFIASSVAVLIALACAPCWCATIYVKTDGNDSNDGSSWELAKKTVQAGLDAAAGGDEVWVAQGTYVGGIALKDGVKLCGGYSGSGSTRDIKAYVTVLDGNPGADLAVVLSYSGVTSAAVIDGFTIRNGHALRGAGVYCDSSSPTISNNTITGNTAHTVYGVSGQGGGIYCVSSSPTISNNTITGNSASDSGGGIYCSYSSPTISNNLITANRGERRCGGIHCEASWPTVSSNTIMANTGSSAIFCILSSSAIITNNTITRNGHHGIFCLSSSSAIVTNNTITANGYSGISCPSSSSSAIITNNTITANGAGGGINCGSSSATISNNTVTANGGRGINCGSSSATISNNIVVFNSSGIYSSGGNPALRNNCVYGNTSYDYSGLSPGVGDISSDPSFLNRFVGEHHLRPGSPCIDAGDDSAVQTGWTDLDGKQRILGARVDMGCFEWDTAPYWVRQVGQAKAVPEGHSIELRSKPVTAAFPGACYVEESDRSSGLRILWPTPVAVGDLVTAAGQLALDNGERALQAASLSFVSHDESSVPRALGMTNLSLGGGDHQFASNQGQKGVRDFPEPPMTGLQYSNALNNIGLLVTVFGNVTYAGEDHFYLDDGSKLNDDSGHIGVKVSAPGMSIPSSGYVKVTGISSCEKKGTDLVRLIRAIEILPVP